MRTTKTLRFTSLIAVVGLLGTACTSDPAAPPSGGSGESPASNGPASAGAPKQAGPDDSSEVDPILDPSAGTTCTGEAGKLYALNARTLGATDEIPLCRFEGAVLLVVNVASHCGYTPQYGPLQALYDKYKAQKFYVLGFPSNSFNQESTDEKEISTFCTNQYKITFPMFAIGDVNGANTQPVYKWLKSQPDQSADVAWNFEKFLITRDGKIAKRFLTGVTPDDPSVVSAIEAELAK